MPKLKGLLDTARTKLTGLLGDFPQGFNAGAVAGFPGWAGDMAYMADTARLALTGADQQAAPENYVGTTDYIAKQAGYPVPQTLSGQLGAAVGGLMSPGPGDLAKFAPVLSAIPFWHGSPHKFDRFDLAHMGKGEGAQAYGWGAYGAESPEVAKQYLNVDPSVPVPPRRQFMGQDLEPGTPEYHAARLASEGKESLAGLRKLVAGWISDARPGEPTDGYQKTLEILNQAQKKSDFKQLKPEPYLYRGEYRWPDPAKEAATPLTGEDLLQWDRPLSEQPSILAKLKADGFAIADDATLTGEDFYTRLQREVGGEPDEISQSLNAAGVPGIRYLDGMSRTDGSGTHNLVMFSDEGIKLLERNGKPIEDFAARRAGKAKPYREAMGADTMPAMPKQEPTKPDYGITHRPPMRDSGAPLFDATGGGNVYPDDVYSAKAQQYYGTGDAKLDRETFRLLQSYRNEPDAPVTIYRAVPADVDATDINAGDWVTVNKAYADMHGQGFDGGYKIIKKQVKAKDIYTNGDSIHEWGYDPDGL